MRSPKVCFFFPSCVTQAGRRPASRLPPLITEHVDPYVASDRFIAFGIPIRELKTRTLRLAVGFACRYIFNAGGARSTRTQRRNLMKGNDLSRDLLDGLHRLIAQDRFSPFGVSVRLMRRHELLVTLAYILLYPNPSDSPFDPDYHPRGATLH